MSSGNIVRDDEGQRGDLGIVKLRVIPPSASTSGSFSLMDFKGGDGPWTILHVHNHCEESFYVPGGNEEMFIELSKLPGDAITDPAARAKIAQKYDSIPVQQ